MVFLQEDAIWELKLSQLWQDKKFKYQDLPFLHIPDAGYRSKMVTCTLMFIKWTVGLSQRKNMPKNINCFVCYVSVIPRLFIFNGGRVVSVHGGWWKWRDYVMSIEDCRKRENGCQGLGATWWGIGKYFTTLTINFGNNHNVPVSVHGLTILYIFLDCNSIRNELW